MKRVIAALAAVLLCPLTVAAGAQQSASYEVVQHEKDLMIPMRDGVKLATDVYRPARNGRVVDERLPILLQRTPYNKGSRGQAGDPVEYFVKNGYVVVVQDTRGRYQSEGVFSKYHDYDAYDGYDTIEWLARLSYTDGKVGMWGTSYGAHTQADPAKLGPPSLKTMVLNMGGTSNAWKHTIRENGAFHQWQFFWAFANLVGETDNPLVAPMMEVEKRESWLTALPLRKGLNPLSIAPNFEDYYLRMATHGNASDWKGLGRNWEDYYAQTADVPMIHIGGWYDVFTRGTVDNYVGLARLKKGPVRLLMGPWTHGGNARSFAGDVEFGTDAAIPDFATGFHLRWFDHFLKGKRTAVESQPPVRIFVMGTGDGHKDESGRLFHGGYWRDAESWPLPSTRFVEYYFHADGRLAPARPGAGPASTTYTYDPRDPVPTIGGAYYFAPGGFDQREREDMIGSTPPYLPLHARPDVVVFQTDPLEQEVEVVGPIVVKLYASSSAVDTDFTMKLVDVCPPSQGFPSGFALNITDGIVRARYRNSPDRQELMRPGEVYEFTIEVFPTANVFKRGHRIRVDISSSNFPKFDVNPNTGEPLGQHRRMIPADNTIHHSATRPSHIVLPIVPSGRR